MKYTHVFEFYNLAPINLAFYSLQATSTHVIGVIGQVNKDLTFSFFPAVNLITPINLTITGLILDEPSQLRTA